jgi:hypothetical protein
LAVFQAPGLWSGDAAETAGLAIENPATTNDPEAVMHRSARNAVLALLTFCAAEAWAAAPPVAVSPGGATSTAIADRCPTFGWAGVAGAEGYELVVYRVGGGDVAADPVLTQRVPGAALGWSPALDRCLERGVPYAWSVRAIPGEASSSWADPLFFEIAASPPADELAAALEVVRRHLAVEGGSARNGTPLEAPREVSEPGFGASDPVAGQVGLRSAPGRNVPTKVSSAAAGNPGATMSVRGEVRTIDFQGEPRLWGRGRAGTIVYPRVITGSYCSVSVAGEGGGPASLVEYGLSRPIVDWGSAADACPAGVGASRSFHYAA